MRTRSAARAATSRSTTGARRWIPSIVRRRRRKLKPPSRLGWKSKSRASSRNRQTRLVAARELRRSIEAVHVFTKCANPLCSTPFEYHLGGSFYRFSQGTNAPRPERNTHSVVHFWLCPQCSEFYALNYDGTNCLLIQSIGYRARDRAGRIGGERESLAQAGRVADIGPRKGGRP